MSANMAAATGKSRWKTRYRATETKLVKESNLNAAMSILEGEEYRVQKEIYQKGMDDVLLELSTLASAEGAGRRRTSAMAFIFTGIGAIAILAMSVNVILVSSQRRNALKDAMRSSTDLKDTNSELEKKNQELDDFLHVASSDLKSPLRGIGTSALRVCEEERDGLSNVSHDYLRGISERAFQLEKLIDDLLVFHRSDTSASRKEALHIGVMAEEIFKLANPPEGISLVVGEKIPIITTHRIPLELVLRHLIVNGVVRLGTRAGVIRIGCKKDGDRHRFSVAEGWAEGNNGNLRKNDQEKSNGGSGGMGLTIATKVIESRGESMTTLTEPTGGVEYSFGWQA